MIIRAFLIGLLLTGGLFAADDATRFQATGSSSVILLGSSNLAPWRCSGTTINAQVEIDASLGKINEVIDRIEDGNIAAWMLKPEQGRFPQPRFRMSVPIETLDCGHRVMERDMSAALKARRHPNIEFRFKSLSAPIRRDIDRNRYEARIAGDLTAAGVTRHVEVDVIAQRLSRTRFRLRAELPMRMTDFGITPPTGLFGLIKAHDKLTVRFDLIVEEIAILDYPLAATAAAARSVS